MEMKCKQCGKELQKLSSVDICLDCSRENVRKIFKENPEVKEAFKETIEDMKKPENIKKMVGSTVKALQGLQALQGKSQKE